MKFPIILAAAALALSACAVIKPGEPDTTAAQNAAQCATAQRGFAAAKAISAGVNLTPAHKATADQATAAAGILLDALCPATVVVALAP